MMAHQIVLMTNDPSSAQKVDPSKYLRQVGILRGMPAYGGDIHMDALPCRSYGPNILEPTTHARSDTPWPARQCAANDSIRGPSPQDLWLFDSSQTRASVYVLELLGTPNEY